MDSLPPNSGIVVPSNLLLDFNNYTLAYFSQLPKNCLNNLLCAYQHIIKQNVQSRMLSNTIAIYALSVALFTSLAFYAIKDPEMKKIVSIIALTAFAVCFLSLFVSLVKTYKIQNATYWQNLVIIFSNCQPQNTHQ